MSMCMPICVLFCVPKCFRSLCASLLDLRLHPFDIEE